MSGYPFPISGPKIHPPLLRSDTLSRPRLNDWLDRATAGRLGLIVAEAGFGKTTLLADWASKTNRRIAWYRLEPDDRDWLVFLRHLVAAGRELDPDFGTDTLELILSLGVGGPTQQDVAAAIVREYADFGAALPDGLTLIFDDHHVIDGTPETDAIVRSLVERTGEGLSIVIASRAVPRVPLGKIRARGGVQRLDGKDLCFDVPETERLFRDAYRHPLDHDVVTELIKRTEGWAALLTLVRTSIEDKAASEARALVAQLSATRGDLYDFLAEEVLASLSPDMQRFLTRVSVLVAVDEECASIVDDAPTADVPARIVEAENLGLLSRPDRDAPHRFHPLVRDFLYAHLVAQLGAPAVRALHRKVAEALEPTDWFGAAWHYRAAGDAQHAGQVIDANLEEILATGAVESLGPLLDGSAGSADRPPALVLRSRLELARGSSERAESLASAAVEAARGTPVEASSLLNLATMQGLRGFSDRAVLLAGLARDAGASPPVRSIADAFVMVGELAKDGDFVKAAEYLSELADQQGREGHQWHRAITLLNYSAILEWTGDIEEALAAATESELLMTSLGSRGVERAAAIAARGVFLAKLGRMDEARRVMAQAEDLPSELARDEALIEHARIEVALGDRATGERAAAACRAKSSILHCVRGEAAMRRRDWAEARRELTALNAEPITDVAGRLRAVLLECQLLVLTESPGVHRAVAEASALADRQRVEPFRRLSQVLEAVATGGAVGRAIAGLGPAAGYLLSTIAEVLVTALDRIDSDVMPLLEREVGGRPDRWREPLLHEVESGGRNSLRAADLLVHCAVASDAERLRTAAKGRRELRPAALAVTRRLARTVHLDDLGHVQARLGDEPVRIVRRKVLGLLCFLVSRPTMAATRDQAIDALWPELSLDTAGNSLHQTIYFLRRIFEPDYNEAVSAGYVTYDGDVVALSRSLVESTSREVWTLLRQPDMSNANATRLLTLYRGKFALDFAYEEWAEGYRDTLHAGVLAAVERAIEDAIRSRSYDSAINLARQLLAIDPTADTIELALLRAYRASGRHAAASEQYAHYAAYLRDELGSEPPALEDL